MPLLGKPLIQWTIDAAKASGLFSDIVVTSDDQQILAIAADNGLHAIARPASLADAHASSVDVVNHALQQCQQAGITSSHFMLLQPTSPLRAPEDIVQAVHILQQHEADSVISMCPCEHPPQWSIALPADQSLSHFQEHDTAVSDSSVRLNGAIYLCDSDHFQREQRFFCGNSRAMVMPVERSVDIDTRTDFLFAETLANDVATL